MGYNPDSDPSTLDHMCAEAMVGSEVVTELRRMFAEKRWYTLCNLDLDEDEEQIPQFPQPRTLPTHGYQPGTWTRGSDEVWTLVADSTLRPLSLRCNSDSGIR